MSKRERMVWRILLVAIYLCCRGIMKLYYNAIVPPILFWPLFVLGYISCLVIVVCRSIRRHDLAFQKKIFRALQGGLFMIAAFAFPIQDYLCSSELLFRITAFGGAGGSFLFYVLADDGTGQEKTSDH